MEALIVIPTYNERENIERIVSELLALPLDLHVLVVDDNSPDGTGRLVEEWTRARAAPARAAPPGQAGARAARTSRASSGRWPTPTRSIIFEMDADFSHDPAAIPRFLETIRDADLVVGSRYVDGVTVVNWPLSRLILSVSANIYTRIVTGMPLHDATGGFKCFRREVLEALPLDRIKQRRLLVPDRDELHVWKRGFRIVEMPIVFTDRLVGASKMSRRIIWEAAFMVWKLRFASITEEDSVTRAGFRRHRQLQQRAGDPALPRIACPGSGRSGLSRSSWSTTPAPTTPCEMVRREFPWATVVAGRENLGYSKGVNARHPAGARALPAHPEPDTVVRRGAIAPAARLRRARRRDAGIVGPSWCFTTARCSSPAAASTRSAVLLLRRTPLGRIFKNARRVRDHLMLDFDHASTREVDWVLGAAMFVRRDAIDTVGMMDERFFLYFEDVDWCYRMKQKGLKVYYLADAVIEHGYKRESAQTVLNRSFIAHLVSLFRYYEKWNAAFYFAQALSRDREGAAVPDPRPGRVQRRVSSSAYYLRVLLADIFTNPIFPARAYQRFVVFENLLFVFTFAVIGLYRIRRETKSTDELFAIGKRDRVRVDPADDQHLPEPDSHLFAHGGGVSGAVRDPVRLAAALRRAPAAPRPAGVQGGPEARLRGRTARRAPARSKRELIQNDALGFDVVGVVDTDGAERRDSDRNTGLGRRTSSASSSATASSTSSCCRARWATSSLRSWWRWGAVA